MCSGTNNNSSAHNKTKQRPPPNNPNKITVLKRDQSGNDGKTQNLNLPCISCNSTKHPTPRCLETRKLRDKKRQAPANFCETHCGRVYALCNKKDCAIITTKTGKSLNLTCQKPNHSKKNVLLCDIESCRKVSEK